MNEYRAVISGGSQLAEQPVILSAQIVDHAIQWAFQCAAEDGVDAERNPYQVELQVNGRPIATITMDVWQNLSWILAQVRIAREDGQSMVLRTMNISRTEGGGV